MNTFSSNVEVIQFPKSNINNKLNIDTKEKKLLTDINQSFKIRGLINVSLSLQEPYNLTINSEFFMEIPNKPSNYSLEIDSVNYSFIEMNNNFSFCLIESESYFDGSYEIIIYIEYNQTIWEKYKASIIIDNTAPQVGKIDFPWNTVQPNTSTNLTVQCYDSSNITSINVTVFQLSTHIIITSEVFPSPISNESLVINVPGLPFGFHGYIKIYMEDELGNKDTSESYNFRVRSIAINRIEFIDLSYGSKFSINDKKNTFTLFRDHHYYLRFNLTNLLLIDEEEFYYISLNFSNEYTNTWILDFDSEDTYISFVINPDYNGTCLHSFLSVEWFQISAKDQINTIEHLVYTKNIGVYILPNPGDYIILQNILIISIFLISGIIYRLQYRYYGPFNFKEPYTSPSHTKGFLLSLLIITGFFLLGVLIYASLISNIILSILLSIHLSPMSLLFVLIFIPFTITIFTSALILSRDTVDNFSNMLKDKEINNKFDNLVPLIIFLILLFSISFNLNMLNVNNNTSFLTSKFFPFNNLLELVRFLSLYYCLQFYVARPIHRRIKYWKRRRENTLLFEILLLFLGLIVFSTICLWTYPFTNFFIILILIGLVVGTSIQIFLHTILLKSISITPSNWVLPKLEHQKVNPHHWNADINYTITHPRFVRVFANFFNDEKIQVTETSKNKSLIKVNKILEFGVYRIEFRIGLKLSFLFFGIQKKRSFEIKPYVDEKIVRTFLYSIGFNKIERISNFDLNPSYDVPGRRIFQITKVEHEMDRKFLRSLIYVSSETVSVNIIRDFYAIIGTDWVKNERIGILICPTPLDVYSALQRTLYQTEDDVIIITILYSDIIKHLNSKTSQTSWRRMFDKITRRYANKQDLFSFTSPIDDPSQFFGRDGIITEIVNSCDLKQPFAILGFYRIGKSSIAREFARRYKTRAIVFIYRLSGTIGYQSLLEDIWWKLWNQLRETTIELNVQEKSYSKDNPLTSFRQLLSTFSKLKSVDKNGEKSRIIMIFDELTKFMESNFSQTEKLQFLEFIRLLDEEFPFLTIGVILHDDRVTNNSQFPTFQYFTEYWVTGLEHSEAQTMILDLAKRMEINFPYVLVQKIVTHWDGFPILIRFFCSMLYKRYGSNIPEFSEREFNTLLFDEDFYRKENGTFKTIWEDQLSQMEHNILTKIVNNDFVNLKELDYQTHVKKLILKGLIDDTLTIKSNSLQRWIRRNKIN